MQSAISPRLLYEMKCGTCTKQKFYNNNKNNKNGRIRVICRFLCDDLFEWWSSSSAEVGKQQIQTERLNNVAYCNFIKSWVHDFWIGWLLSIIIITKGGNKNSHRWNWGGKPVMEILYAFQLKPDLINQLLSHMYLYETHSNWLSGLFKFLVALSMSLVCSTIA